MPTFNPLAPVESLVGKVIYDLIKDGVSSGRDFETIFRKTLTAELKRSNCNARALERLTSAVMSEPELQNWLNGAQLPTESSILDSLAGKVNLEPGILRSVFVAFGHAIAADEVLSKELHARRQTRMIEGLQQLVARLSGDTAATDARDFVQGYRDKMREAFATINLFGEKRAVAARKGAGLDSMANVEHGFVFLKLAEWRDDQATSAGDPGRTSLDDLFFHGDIKRILLRGLPGSGKTTLLRYLTWRFAAMEGCIPVYLRLKKFKQSEMSGESGLRALREYIREHLDAMCDSHEQKAELCREDRFLQQGMVVMLDGVDEIEDPTTDRHFADTLDKLARKYPRCRIILASRPIGLRKEDYPRFQPYDVLPLDRPAVDAYLEKWFVGETKRIARVRETLDNKERIAELARNPFLLSMICYTFKQGADNDTNLIERRSDLYQRCTESLLQRLYDPEAEREKQPDLDAAMRLLKDISWRFFLWQEADFPVEQVGVMGKRALNAETTDATDNLLARLERETGLVQLHREGYAFVHRSLWEYFTARALLDKKMNAAIRQAANPDWEEALRLYAGLLDDAEKVRQLVAGLWNINRPLALRVTTEVATPAKELIQPLIKKEGDNRGRLLLIESIAQSLPLIPPNSREKLVDETLRILLIDCEEKDCEVIFFAQQLLQKLDMQPLAAGGLLYDLFDLARAGERRKQLLADPENHFEWLDVGAGSFLMGDNEHESDEAPAHEVALSGFQMTKHPVTNRLLHGFPFGEKYPGYGGDDCPAVANTWYEAYYFALWLGARLPTEAQWEYACRGGSGAKYMQYYFGDDAAELNKHAWFNELDRKHAHAVHESNPHSGQENLNALGLANMHGNVYEWCSDWHDGKYYDACKKKGLVENPTGPETGSRRVLRGGSWNDRARDCRSADRGLGTPGYRNLNVGFRLVFVP